MLSLLVFIKTTVFSLRKEEFQPNHKVLGLGYAPSEYDVERFEWGKYTVSFDFAESVDQAVEKLRQQEYICVAVRSNQITYEEICKLRQAEMVPVIILPPYYSAEEAHICARFSAIHYARAVGYREIAALGSDESLRYGLNLPAEKREPLTIITVRDLSFCMEHRSVEVRGIEVELTEKEFDILALLLSNPKKLFSFEMIMDTVWHDDISFYSPKAITTHINTAQIIRCCQLCNNFIDSFTNIFLADRLDHVIEASTLRNFDVGIVLTCEFV